MIKINVSKDFTNIPGGRFISEGKFSGEEFRNEILYPAYKEAVSRGCKIEVNLDGCYGFATSFLEEAFGGIVRIEKNKKFKEILSIVSEDRPDLIHKVFQYID